MDKIEKALKKLTNKEKSQFKKLLLLIRSNQLAGLDVKKLVGHDDIYRIRKGNYRIIFRMNEKTNVITILALERRSDRTYSKY